MNGLAGGKQVPEGFAGMTASQVEGQPVQALTDPAADLYEPGPEGPQLQMGDLEPCQPALDGIEQPVGGAMQ